MAYNNNIPQPAQTLTQSQPQLLANFAEIFTWLTVDHNTFNTANAGKHAQVTFVQQLADPDIENNRIALYSKTPTAGALTGVNELYKVNSFGSDVVAQKEFPMTASEQVAIGYSYLPSGLLMKWGVVTRTGNNALINFPNSGIEPQYQTVVYVSVCAENFALVDPNVAVTLVSFNAASLTVNVTQRTTNNAATTLVSYLAIGW